MTTQDQPASQQYSTRRLVSSTLKGILLAGWLALAPVLALAIGMLIFGFIPQSFSFFSLVPRIGNLPQPVIGFFISIFSFLLQGAVFLPVWRVTRKREGRETLHAVTGGLLVTAGFMLGWALAGLPFPERSVFPSVIRLGLAVIALGIVFRPLHRTAPAGLGKPAASTMLLAAGVSFLLLLPWMIFGALGTIGGTLAALVEALSYGVGEELLLRGVVAALVARATGRPRLGFLIAILTGLAMQMGYMLPLGDWISTFRLFNAMAIGLLATEFAMRGSLWGAILVHSAFELGFPAWVDWRMEFSLPHPAALESLGWVFLLGAIFAAVRIASNAFAKNQPAALRLSVSAAFAVIALAGSSAGYAAWGHPGFTGDGFLIVFREQGDVSGAQSITDRTQRIAFLYQTLTATAERVQAPVRAELDRLGLEYRPHYLINMIEVRGRTDLMPVFSKRADVREVLLNPNVRVSNYNETMDLLALPIPGQGVEWNITAVGAPSVWERGVNGSGIVVAVADTGVDWTHPALQSKYRGWTGGAGSHDYNWYDPWDESPAPRDDFGHGTFSLGIILGEDGTENRIGMAPGAEWIACRNMRSGIGNPGMYLSCMEFFLAPFPLGGDPFHDGRPELAPHVINNSWGCPEREGCDAETLAPAFRILRAAGIMMVAAAGNEGPACQTAGDPPANSGDVFTVGASNDLDELAFFSSRGPANGIIKPDITAPGWMVRSSVLGGKYTISAGTSFSAPHVTGAVALLWSAFPELIGDIDRTEDILRRSADPVTVAQVCGAMEEQGTPCLCGGDTSSSVPNNSFGAGILNVDAAYKEMVSLAPMALP
ncbi:MAG: S8 family serine peptidase [Anaerolineales bacterium]